MKDGFLRISASAPKIELANPAVNGARLAARARELVEEGSAVVVFPELSVCGYTAGDLLFSDALLGASEEACAAFAQETADLPAICFIGVPVRAFGRIYNCAAAICGGRLLGLVPKHALCNYEEFREERWFARPQREPVEVTYAGQRVMLGCDQIFACAEMPTLSLAAEICEDIWVSVPLSSHHAAAGATLVVNLCASTEYIGKPERRRNMVRVQSQRATCAYVLADAGEGESTGDLVFAGNHVACELGEVVGEKPMFSEGDTLSVTLDLGRVERARLGANFTPDSKGYIYHTFSLPLREAPLSPLPARYPFIPADGSGAEAVLAIQTAGLAHRLEHVGAKAALVGVSGGLDSALALIAAVRAMAKLGKPATAVHAVTMPCFGTSGRTRRNAEKLCRALGVTFTEVDIRRAVEGHLGDIGHPLDLFDAAYENAQARERTQVLMDLANREGGLVVGTGDLSELALGWTTYGGDHLSMYGVNASVPKTLIRHVLAACADAAEATSPDLARVIRDILDTPVSPELLPPRGDEIAQITEKTVGPYELHDFFLWHFLRGGASVRKLYRLALAVFGDTYTPEEIKNTLCIFVRRFFSQQFKRSCLPDGPKVTAVSFSPRGDLCMPGDAVASLWIREAESL